jgi:hypothetical protein
VSISYLLVCRAKLKSLYENEDADHDALQENYKSTRVQMNPECVFDLSFFYSTFTPVRAGDKRQSQWTFILEKHKLHGNCTLIRLMLCDVILHWKVATKIFRVQGPAPRIQFVLQKDQRSERVYSSVTSVHTACKPCRCPQNKTTSRQQNKTKNISSTGPSPGSFARSSKTT